MGTGGVEVTAAQIVTGRVRAIGIALIAAIDAVQDHRQTAAEVRPNDLYVGHSSRVHRRARAWLPPWRSHRDNRRKEKFPDRFAARRTAWSGAPAPSVCGGSSLARNGALGRLNWKSPIAVAMPTPAAPMPRARSSSLHHLGRTRAGSTATKRKRLDVAGILQRGRH